jgi:RNA methyltransferase, TrmH family
VATETSFADWMRQFIADAAGECADASGGDDSRLRTAVPAGDSARPGGEPAPRVLVSGWPEVTGVLAASGHALWPDGWQALVAACDERALRDLLLGLPFGAGGVLFLTGRWMLATVTDLFAGEEVTGRADRDAALDILVPAGATVFRGTRRASGLGRLDRAGRPDDAADRVPDPPVVTKDAPAVQRVRALREPAARRAEASYVAEGTALVRRALDDGLPVESVLCRNELVTSTDGAGILRACGRGRVACYRCSDGLMGTITSTRPLPAVIAAVHFSPRDVAALHTNQASVLLVAEDLQNPDNLGMVIRTADGGGAHALVVTTSGVDPLHKNCVRAARGAVGRLPIYACGDLPGWLGGLAERGFTILGATAHGDADVYAQVLRPPLAILVGNEETGLRQPTLAACTSRVRIPMAPGQSSLNVGVAAGVLLFEFGRQRARR